MQFWLQNLIDWLCDHGYMVSYDIKNEKALWERVAWLEDGVVDKLTVYIDPTGEAVEEAAYTSVVDEYGNLIRVRCAEPQEIFNTLIDMVSFFNKWHRDLLGCVLMKRSLNDMLRIAARVFRSPMILGAEDGYLFAYTSEYLHLIPVDQQKYFTNEALSYMMHHNSGGEKFRSKIFGENFPSFNISQCFTLRDSADHVRSINANLFYRGQRRGFVNTYEYRKPFYPGDLYLMQIFTHIVERRMALEPEKFFETDYLEYMLQRICTEKEVDWSKLNYIFQYHGWDENRSFVVLCVRRDGAGESNEPDRYMRFLTRMRERFQACHGVVMDQKMVILVNCALMPDLERLVAYLHSYPQPLFVGISNTYQEIKMTYYYYCQAAETLESAVAAHVDTMHISAIIAQKVRGALVRDKDLVAYRHPVLRTLLEYDWKHQTNFAKTLSAFILCGQNYTEAAKLLDVHRNTLIKRIEKIKVITEYDDHSPVQFEALLLSILLTPELAELLPTTYGETRCS